MVTSFSTTPISKRYWRNGKSSAAFPKKSKKTNSIELPVTISSKKLCCRVIALCVHRNVRGFYDRTQNQRCFCQLSRSRPERHCSPFGALGDCSGNHR